MSDDLLAPGLPPPDKSSSSSSPPIGAIVAIGALLIAALGFTLFGIGYGLGWWGGDDETEPEQPTVAEAKPDITEPPAGPAFAGAELTPEVDPLAAPVAVEQDERVLEGLEPVPEFEPRSSGRGGQPGAGSGASDSSGSSGGAASGGKSAPRVSVTLVLKHYQRVDVKLGGKVFTLDSDTTVKIRPGGYRIELRKAIDTPWQPAGLIEIDLGHSYRVTLLDPPLAKVEIVK